MATLPALLVDAAAGQGPLLKHGVSPHEARELLYLMVHAQDAGLVPAGAHGLPVAHKIGWLDAPTTTWPSFSPTTGRWSSRSTATASRTPPSKRSVKLRRLTYWQPTTWGKVLA
jgi:hypothetical protein